MASTDILQPPRADGSARIAPARISRIPLSHQALSLGGWFLAVLSSELAIHGVGEPIRGAMLPLLIPEAAVAFLAGQRYWRTRLPRWLLASFAATSLTLNGVFSAFTDLGTTLHDVHQASDMAAIGTMFFLLVESFTPGVRASRIASLAGLLSCCGFVLVVPALLFGLGPPGLAQLLPLIVHEQSASVLALPVWTPFVGLLPAVVGLVAGNALVMREAPEDTPPDAPGSTACQTALPSNSSVQSRPVECAPQSASAVRRPRRRRVIGRPGTVARPMVGLAFLVLAVTLVRADLRDVVLGVVVLPAAATLLLALRGRGAPPLRLGAAGHLVTIVIVLVLSLVFRGATVLLFYGSAMLVAAVSGSGGCEVTAVSNWLRGRDDQIGCPLFAPFDALDRRSEVPRRQA
jgi:hypothetical protein